MSNIGGKKKRNHYKIDKLKPELKAIVETMILTNTVTYAEIVRFLADEGFGISAQAVCNYAKNFLASREALDISQQNFKMIADELEKYPDLDSTEALSRIIANGIFNKLSTLKPEDYDKLNIEDIFKQTTSLIRATAYKKRIDAQNKDLFERGFEHAKTLIFTAMSKDDPELYDSVVTYLNKKKAEGESGLLEGGN